MNNSCLAESRLISVCHVAFIMYVLQIVFDVLYFVCSSGVFRGRATVRCPPLWPNYENFLRRLYMKRCVFCRFPARIAKFNNVWLSFFISIQYAIKIAMWDCIWYDAVIFCVSEFQKKMRKFCGFHWTFKSSASASGGPRWGLRPQTPVIGSLSARSPCPPFAKS